MGKDRLRESVAHLSAGLGQKAGTGTVPLGQCHACEPCCCGESAPAPGKPGPRVLLSSCSVTWAVHVSGLVLLPSAKLLLQQGPILASGAILPGRPAEHREASLTSPPAGTVSRRSLRSLTCPSPRPLPQPNPSPWHLCAGWVPSPGHGWPSNPVFAAQGCSSNIQLSDQQTC